MTRFYSSLNFVFMFPKFPYIGAMQLFVKTFSGKTRTVEISHDDSVATLRARIGAENASLFYGGRCLEDGETIGDYRIGTESTIDIVVPLEGGKGKKKKKRVFTKPKKNAHRHKNVPMRVLKYYKVEGDGDNVKVTHQRMECPHPNCGAGIFMAAHKDRQTCGKCHLTYVFQKK